MHQEALDLKQKELFAKLDGFSDFYLAGGTALALQLGHRISVDFDLFSDKEVVSGSLALVEKMFRNESVEVLVNNRDELTVLAGGIKLTLLHFPFPPLFELVEADQVKLLSIKDIAANKAYVLGRRATYKDYVDLYFIVNEGHSTLADISMMASDKFGDGFDQRLFLEQLIFLDDVSDEAIRFLKKPVGKNDIEAFFKGEISKIELK